MALLKQMINIPNPDLQVDFSKKLISAEGTILQQALLKTISKIDSSQLDKEIHEYVSSKALNILAGRGLRAELVFALPIVLKTNPFLLGYYRLLLGFSQKVFYSSKFGLSRGYFSMESKGIISPRIAKNIPALCRALNKSAMFLLESIEPQHITKEHLHELTVLTFGPQLRGGRNVDIGTSAVKEVFKIIEDITKPYANSITENMIVITDLTKRQIEIKFGSDPDIGIFSIGQGNKRTPLLAIEVKGGTDYSNSHNRLGEAEKSHLKAKKEGFNDLWTIVNVEGLSDEDRRAESPTTTAFFDLFDLISREGAGYEEFKDQLLQKLRLPED
ncbi:MAG: XcyI family restriction endonuclease [Firmicutes bacterium]|nr:XcyI family restriction endonuclease [Bacillota bacterium]